MTGFRLQFGFGAVLGMGTRLFALGFMVSAATLLMTGCSDDAAGPGRADADTDAAIIDGTTLDDGGDGADSSVCTPQTCPDGCCLDGRCVASTNEHCGAPGTECRACSDQEHCGPTGCLPGHCEPNCAGRCAGAPDDCGGTCQTNDCRSGCCDADHQCLPGTDDANCGSGGMACMDCRPSVRTCAQGLCVTGRSRDAVFVAMDAPERLDPGQTMAVSVTMQNVGSETWISSGPHRLGAQNPQDNNVWGVGRIDVPGSIAPGATVQFDFQVQAPSAPGLYHFQWRMLLEQVEWFGDYSMDHPIAVWNETPVTCEAVRGLAGTQQDASGPIQTCIDQAPSGGVVWLPVGRYHMDGPVVISSHPVILQTEGRSLWDDPCLDDGSDCAVLAASASFSATGGILQVLADRSVVDHLVIDGNKASRAQTSSGQQCGSMHNAYGYNMRLGCDDCALTNSVTRDALCGTGCEVSGVRRNVTLWRNSVLDCGVHNAQGMWSDGITVHDCTNCSFTENRVRNSTDVDLIFGGCPGCMIQDNEIFHGADFTTSSFAALMIHAWADGSGNNVTSGDFTGAVTWRNLIDCGSAGGCGFGLYLGADAWYIANVHGGRVYANQVIGAQLGLLVDDVHDMAVYDNPVSSTVGQTRASCGQRQTADYAKGTRTTNLDTSADRFATTYASQDWDLCIPNWWDQ